MPDCPVADDISPPKLIDYVFAGDLNRVCELLVSDTNLDDPEYGTRLLFEALQEPPEFFGDAALSILELLLDAGLKVDGREEGTGRTPLHEAVRPGVRAVKGLLARGADPNARSDDGSTPLHECVQYSAVEPARELLRAGADALATDDLGRTPGDLARQEVDVYPDDEDAKALADLLMTRPAP